MSLNAFDLASGVLAVSLILALVRLARGPSLPDRIVALELTSMLTVGIILIKVADGAAPLFIDVAVIIALIGFLGTVTFAYYIERESLHD